MLFNVRTKISINVISCEVSTIRICMGNPSFKWCQPGHCLKEY